MIKKDICGTHDHEHCFACSKKILGWTVLGNAFLAAIKLAGGIMSGSSGLIADGMQSISCVATSMIIMASLLFSGKESDERFPYGYAKLDFIVALMAFSALIGLGLFIVLSSLLGIVKRDFSRPDIMVLPVAMTSVLLTYMMKRYNACAGDKLESPGMIANACHAGADLFSSGAVIFSIIIAQFGPAFAATDKMAALIVGLCIIKDSLANWAENLQVILDHLPGRDFKERIENVIGKIRPEYKPEVIKFKRVGKKFWIGVSLCYQAKETARQADASMSSIRQALLKKIPAVSAVDFFVS